MKIWRKQARERLIADLGGVCPCGSTQNLVIAHKTPLTPEQHKHRVKIGGNSRIVLYRKEHAQGLIKLLCQSCNIKEAHEPCLALDDTQPF